MLGSQLVNLAVKNKTLVGLPCNNGLTNMSLYPKYVAFTSSAVNFSENVMYQNFQFLEKSTRYQSIGHSSISIDIFLLV